MALVAVALLAASCARERAPVYTPHENLLSVAAEFELLSAKDPYRDPPGEILTGQDVSRATLVRLANYASLHPGRFAPETAALRARAIERLRDFQSARDAYLEAAAYETEIAEDCRARAAILEKLLAARATIEESPGLEETLLLLSDSATALRRLASEADKPLYRSLALAEAEQAEVMRAEILANNRWVLKDGEARALDALAALTRDHAESHRALSHALRLARFHRQLAEEEARVSPPGTLEFDRRYFVENVDAALDLLHRVSQADGRPERLVATYELDTVLALREMVLEQAD